MDKFKKFVLFPLLTITLFFSVFFLFLQINYYPPILMYHSLGTPPVETPQVEKEIFKQQLRYLKEHGFKVILVEELAESIKKRKIERKVVAITFDDGYKNNLEAAELLKEFGFPATIFVIVNKINEEGYLGEEDLKYILANTPVNIGSHTLNHKYLPSLSLFELEKEIFLSKKILENMLGREINAFSYPLGGFNREALKIVEKAGYKCGFTTNRGKGKNIFALKRIKITNNDVGLNLWAKLSGFYHIFKRARRPY